MCSAEHPILVLIIDDMPYMYIVLSLDMVMIPCEFCGEPYTADDLVQHQVNFINFNNV